MEACREEKYRGYTIKIYPDDSPESPREWDNFGTMVCWHSRYSLGDKHDFKEPGDAEKFFAENDCVALPLYLYDHSGITMSTGRGYPFNDRWDAGQVGWIYVTREQMLKEFSAKRLTKKMKEKAEKILVGEVEVYDDYISGEVYGFMAEDKDGDNIDSCWGFFGDDGVKEAIRQGKDAIYSHIEDVNKKKSKKLRSMIEHKVPLDVRVKVLAKVA